MSCRRLSRLLALVLLAGLLSGCGAKPKTPHAAGPGTFGTLPESAMETAAPDSAAEENRKSGTGTFTMPYNSGYGWDPYNCKSMENRAVMQLVYEGLFTMTPEFEAEPCLCSSFEVNESGDIYTLTLRDAVFSSGKKLTAEDVVESMNRARESELLADRFVDIANYTASGSNTVTIELYDANDRLPCLLTFPIVPVGSSKESPPGTGPFVQSADTLLRQNSQWWQGSGNLDIQTVNLYASASAEDTRDHFELDHVNFVYNNPNASSAAAFHCDYELWNSRSTVMQYIGFNFAAGIFQDQEVRAAVTHAIDRDNIAESVYRNFADAAVLPVAPASGMYYEKLVQEYNYTSAKSAMEELLETATFYLPEYQITVIQNPEAAEAAEKEKAEQEKKNANTDGQDGQDVPEGEDAPEGQDGEAGENGEADGEEEPEEITYNDIAMIVRSGNLSRVTAAREAAKNLEAVGFTVDFRELEDEAFYTALQNGDFDLYYGEVFLKPDFDLRELLLPEGALCYGGLWADSKLETLIYSAMENNGNRYDLYEYIMEKGFLCPVLFVNNAVFTSRGGFSGLNPAPDNLFYEIANVRVNH